MGGDTTSVTGIVWTGLLAEDASIVMLAVYVPRASPDGLTPTEMLEGVEPVEGLTESQLPPEAVALNRMPLFGEDSEIV